MSSFAYVKLMSGEIIPFHIPESLKTVYKISNLRSEYVDYIENRFSQDIDLGRVLFFNENLEQVDMKDIVINGHTYQVLISDPLVRLSFDRTIRLQHNYEHIPRETNLEIINLNWNAYRYMYKEMEYIFTDWIINGGDIYDEESDEDRIEKFRITLEKYNLKMYEDDFDFRFLEEENKISLINAYIKECLGLDMNICSYNFVNE